MYIYTDSVIFTLRHTQNLPFTSLSIAQSPKGIRRLLIILLKIRA